jgi:hypothetical protein
MKTIATLKTALIATLIIGVAVGAVGGRAWAASTTDAAEVRQIRWPDLVPEGWDPFAIMREKNKERGAAILSDADPRILQVMREMRMIWDNAPVNEAMDGAVVKLPGYVVPLEEAGGAIKEFLLVPYFGACIHSPPPPANQIVHVVPAKPARGLRSMDVVWISGKLHAKRQDSVMGKSGYQMDAFKIEPYVAPKQ